MNRDRIQDIPDDLDIIYLTFAKQDATCVSSSWPGADAEGFAAHLRASGVMPPDARWRQVSLEEAEDLMDRATGPVREKTDA